MIRITYVTRELPEIQQRSELKFFLESIRFTFDGDVNSRKLRFQDGIPSGGLFLRLELLRYAAVLEHMKRNFRCFNNTKNEQSS